MLKNGVQKVREQGLRKASGKMPRRMSRQDLCELTEGLSILLGSGMPLDYALETLQGLMDKPSLKKVSAFLLDMVQEGYTLSFAMGKAGKDLFPEAYIGMVRAGEMSGTLGEVLQQLDTGLQQGREMAKHILSSMLYPVILLVACLMAVGFVVFFVLPSFVEVFDGMKMPLPDSAQTLMWLGNFVRENGFILAGAGLLLVLAAVYLLGVPQARKNVDRVLLALGPLGKMIAEWQTATYCRTLGLLVSGGVPLNEAAVYASAATTNLAFRNSLSGVVNDVKEGRSMSLALRKSPFICSIALRMVALSEDTGELGKMLLRTAGLLDKKLKTSLQRVMALFEPMIILFMGLVVGSIVVTMLNMVMGLTHGGF